VLPPQKTGHNRMFNCAGVTVELREPDGCADNEISATLMAGMPAMKTIPPQVPAIFK
jgi:hypothetical protein